MYETNTMMGYFVSSVILSLSLFLSFPFPFPPLFHSPFFLLTILFSHIKKYETNLRIDFFFLDGMWWHSSKLRFFSLDLNIPK